MGDVLHASGSKAKIGDKAKQTHITIGDICWLAVFIFVLRQFDVLDAVRFDPRIRRCHIWRARLSCR